MGENSQANPFGNVNLWGLLAIAWPPLVIFFLTACFFLETRFFGGILQVGKGQAAIEADNYICGRMSKEQN